MNLDVKTTKTFRELREASDAGGRIVVLEGGSRSGKTWAVIQWLVDLCMRAYNEGRGLRVVVAREHLTTLKKTTFNDFKTVLKDVYKVWDDGDMNYSEMRYDLFGSEVLFVGLCDGDKAEGEHGLTCDYVWVNEADKSPWSPVKQLLMRMRCTMVLDFNPACGHEHWLYRSIKRRGKTAWLHSTFRDNPFISEEVRGEILGYEPTEENYRHGTADVVMWNVYGLGKRDVVVGLVFPDWSECPMFPVDARNVCMGMDWGYANDPTALVLKGEVGGELYFQELLYMRGLTTLENRSLSERLSVEGELKRLKVSKGMRIWADCEDAKSIGDLKGAGWNVMGVTKGPGSVKAGIDVMRRYKIKVVAGSDNLKRELGTYKWALDPNGKATNMPLKGSDHIVDSCRYSSYMSCGMSDGRGVVPESGRRRGGGGGRWDEDDEDEVVMAGDGMFDIGLIRNWV